MSGGAERVKMELDYKALREKAEELARVKASLMHPPGHRQDEERKRIADEYYRQYTTPPRRAG